jgi:hypothetical protein
LRRKRPLSVAVQTCCGHRGTAAFDPKRKSPLSCNL